MKSNSFEKKVKYGELPSLILSKKDIKESFNSYNDDDLNDTYIFYLRRLIIDIDEKIKQLVREGG